MSGASGGGGGSGSGAGGGSGDGGGAGSGGGGDEPRQVCGFGRSWVALLSLHPVVFLPRRVYENKCREYTQLLARWMRSPRSLYLSPSVCFAVTLAKVFLLPSSLPVFVFWCTLSLRMVRLLAPWRTAPHRLLFVY